MVVVPGVTVTGDPVSDPGIQLYVDAPVALSVVELPEQSVVVPDDAVTVGEVLTVMACVAVAVQPLAAVPVTVYVVVDAGVTDTGDPVSDPGIQLYVDAPVALSVVELPEQSVVVPEEAVTVGEVFTVINCVAMDEQPALVPVTVYVVVEPGETVTGDPVSDPGIHE